MPPLATRLRHAWNAFTNNKDPTYNPDWMGYSSSLRPDRVRYSRGNERSIITAVYTRIAIDVAAVSIQHVRLDENGSFLETINSPLNDCLNVEANVDQTGRAFIQDLVESMFDEGCVAIVPTDCSANPLLTSSYDILSMRVGKITQWGPAWVRVRLYNERTGQQEEVTLAKQQVAIIPNPLYSVMNEPNSTFQRLIRKLNLLDTIDEQSSSGKLDLIIQLPYTIKTEARRQQAEQRRKDIEMQLAGTKYGIAYTDGTERITQLNRSVENNLMSQIEYLTSMLYSQLGLTTSIFDGTADEKTMLNYYSRTIEPILSAVVDEMVRKFLTKTARTQGQSIMFFRDQFKLVPMGQLTQVAQTLISTEVATPNEIRALIGWKPKDDARADELGNRNINPVTPEQIPTSDEGDSTEEPLVEDTIDENQYVT